VVEFVQFDGKPPANMQGISAESREHTLAGFRDLATHRESLEERSIKGIGPDFNYLVGARAAVPDPRAEHGRPQGCVVIQAKAKRINGRRVSPATIKNEMVSLRTASNWRVKIP
jgi:hypothetical protein